MDPRITQVLNHIEAHLANELSLAHLASVACLSPSRLHRLFKAQTGHTPFKFIENMRLSHAYQLLIAAPQNIQDLSAACGYKDYETFSRAFKKVYCLSPDDLAAITAQIRQQHNGADEVYVAALSEYDTELIQKKFRQLLAQLDLTADQLEATRVYLVDQVSDDSKSQVDLVKNKFRIGRDKKLWQLLIEADGEG